MQSYNPREQAPWFGLFRCRSPLLAESRSISLPPDTKMFQFSGLASLAGYHGFTMVGCPIRTSRGRRFGAARPGFSQLGASFIASESLTIHQLLQLLELSFVSFSTILALSKTPACAGGDRWSAGAGAGCRQHAPLVEAWGFEPQTPTLQRSCSTN